MLTWESYATFDHPQIRHLFSLRSEVPPSELFSLIRPSLRARGWPVESLVEAGQVHGNAVAIVRDLAAGRFYPQADALITALPEVPLVIRVADCGPIYFHDPVRRVIALAHSGRKGTELNIAGATISALQHACGTDPADLRVQLGPCIRPPHYEVDFAARIGEQVRAAGVRAYFDCGHCTAGEGTRYYSYRAERGQTGRMWAGLIRWEK